jgi:hypothetical protein
MAGTDQELRDAILKWAGQDGSSNSKPKEKTASESDSPFGVKSFTEAVGKFAFGVGAFDSTVKRLSGDTDSVFSTLKAAAANSKIPYAADMVNILSTGVKDTKEAANYGRPAESVRLKREDIETGLSTAERQRLYGEAPSNATRGLGLTGEGQNQLYDVLGKAIRNDTGIQDRLKNQTASPDQLAKEFMLAQQGTKGDFNRPEVQQQVVDATKRYADAVSVAAQESGKSKDQIIAETQARLKDGAVQRQLETLKTDAARRDFIEDQIRISAQSKGVQELTKDLSVLGVATNKTAGIYSLMPGPANAYLQAQRELAAATTEEGRRVANQKLKQAETGMVEAQNSDRVKNMAKYADLFPEEQVFQDAKRLMEDRGKAATVEGEQRRTGGNAREAEENLDRRAGNVAGGRLPTGGTNAQIQLTQDFMQSELNIQGRAADILRNIETNVGKGDLNKNIISIGNELKNYGKEPNKGGANSQRVEPEDEVNSSETKKETPNKQKIREKGTLGMTGQTFEPSDLLAFIHQGERVLSPKENQDLNSLFGALKDIKPPTDIASTVGEIKPTTTKPGFGDIDTGGAITLKDLNDTLQQLNKGIMQMVDHTSEMKDHTRETADMSGKFGGNRFAI